METINVEKNGAKPKSSWQKNAEKAAKKVKTNGSKTNWQNNTEKAVQTAEEVTQKIKSLKNDSKAIENITGLIIIGGATIVEGLVLFANLSPYMKAANVLIVKTLGMNSQILKPVGWIIGIAGLASVQFGEIRSLLLSNPSKAQYARASALATIFYAIDCSLAIMFWPPLKVGLKEFVAAPLMGSVNWLNILIIFATLFGAEMLIRLNRALR